jgi:hypothetical protein
MRARRATGPASENCPDPTNNGETKKMFPTSRRARGTAAAVGLGAVLAASSLAPANAASHREAPLTAQDPVIDNTDVYAFVSPADPSKVTLIANFIPFQDPFGGPNYFFFGEDVRYDINIDNDGDAVADITYEFRFTTTDAVPGVPVYATGPIDSLDDPHNRKQTYSVTVVRDGQRSSLGQNLPVPPYNVGPRTTPNYSALANAAVRDLGSGVKSFAGPRDEVFPVDLGSIFDLGGLRPLNSAHLIPLADQPGVRSLDGKNIHSIALEVPAAILKDGANGDPTIGIWSTANRKKVRVFAQNSGAKPVHRGRWVQVSRLGNPLVNEVVIPIALKDTFNTLRPSQDAATLAGLDVAPFATEGDIPLVTDPILADLIEILYPGVTTPPDGSRSDLVSIYLTGIDGLNKQRNGVPAEMLRLNTSIAPSATPNALGVLGGDNAGFPNGRRLGDDVVDISLRAVAGGTPFTPDFNRAPNNALGDGVAGNDMAYLSTFPYIPHPHSGYDTGPLQGDIPDNGVGDNGPTG